MKITYENYTGHTFEVDGQPLKPLGDARKALPEPKNGFMFIIPWDVDKQGRGDLLTVQDLIRKMPFYSFL